MVSLRALLVNAVVGLLILFVANVVGLGVQISIVALLICAVFGVPGALLVILLTALDVTFAATITPLVLG
jgi:inhibitor of the pro-sigma K processing machinery